MKLLRIGITSKVNLTLSFRLRYILFYTFFNSFWIENFNGHSHEVAYERIGALFRVPSFEELFYVYLSVPWTFSSFHRSFSVRSSSQRDYTRSTQFHWKKLFTEINWMMFNLHEKQETCFKFPLKYFWFGGNFISLHWLRFLRLIKELWRDELEDSISFDMSACTSLLLASSVFINFIYTTRFK